METILKENQSYYEIQDYLLNQLAEIASDRPAAIATKTVQPIAEMIKAVEEIGAYDRLHGDRSWKYTLLDDGIKIKITADSGIEIKVIVKNK